MPESMGGLFATVTLDIDDALRQLRLLQGALRQTGAAARGGGGVAQGATYQGLSTGTRQATAALSSYSTATKKAQAATKETAGQIQKLTGVMSRYAEQISKTENAYSKATDQVAQANRVRINSTRELMEMEARRSAQAHQLALAEGRLARSTRSLAAFGLPPRARAVSDVERERRKLNALNQETARLSQANTAALGKENAALAQQDAVLKKLVTARQGAAKATNEMSIASERFQGELESSQGVIQTAIRGQLGVMRSAIVPITQMFQSSALVSGNRVLYGLSRGMTAMGQAFRAGGFAALRFAGILGAVLIAAVATYKGIKLAIQGIQEMTKAGFEHGMEIEHLAIAYESLLGSVAAARNELNFLQQQAITSPFLTEAVVQLDRFLIAQGFLATSMRRDVVAATLDLGAAIGLTNEGLGNVAYALGQVRNAGRLTGDEARQLTNNFINWQDILRTLPAYADKTGLELKKMQEKGEISAADFFEGYLRYAEKFKGASDKMALSLKGVINNLQDIFQFNIGEAFAGLDFGKYVNLAPIKILASWLQTVVGILSSIDFRPFATAIGFLMQALFGRVARWLQTEGTKISTFFQSTLPRYITYTANVVKWFGNIFASVWIVIASIGRSIGAVWRKVLDSFKIGMESAGAGFISWAEVAGFAAGVIAAAFKMASNAALIAIDAIVAGVLLAIATLRTLDALIPFVGGGWDEAKAAGADANAQLEKLGGSITNVATGVLDTYNTVNQEVSTLLKSFKAFKMPEFDLPSMGPVKDDMDATAEEVGEAAEDAGKAVDKFAEMLKDVMDQIFDLTRRWFGMRSEVEAAFLGDKGFTGTIDQIASMGKQLIELLKSIGAESVARYINAATIELLKLARARELVAARLEKAQQKLADAIQAQRDLTTSVRDAARDFALALDVGEEELQVFARISERGFYIEESISSTKSFAEQLKERVKALKKFARDIRELRRRGVDAGLIQQLLEAGPEAGGEVATQLAEGSQAQIRQVNQLQRAAKNTARKLGKYAGKEFKQAGVDQARGVVKGIESELDAIEKSAIGITNAIYKVLLPFAKEAAPDLGEDVGSGIASGIGSQSGKTTDASKKHAAALSVPSAILAYERSSTSITDSVDATWKAWVEKPGTYAPFSTLKTRVVEEIAEIQERIEERMGTIEIAMAGKLSYSGMIAAFWKSIMLGLAPFASGVLAKLFPENKEAYDIAAANYRIFQASTDQISFGSPAIGGKKGTQQGGSAAPATTQSSTYSYAGETTTASPTVNVYIGDTELRGIVNSEIVSTDNNNVQHVNSIRRV